MVRKLPFKEFEKLPLGLREPVKNLWGHPASSERIKAVDELVKEYPNYQKNHKETIIKHIISAFQDENDGVRKKAKSTLAWKLELDALQQLTETMKTSENPDAKKLSAQALSIIRKRPGILPLVSEIKQPVQRPLHYALAQFDPVENPKAFLRLVEDLQKPEYANKNPEWWAPYVNQIKNKYRKT